MLTALLELEESHMTGVIILLASFAIAIIGIFRNNKADSPDRAIVGLNRIGLLLILLSVIGVCAGVAKEISSIRSSVATKAREDARDVVLTNISSQLKGLARGSSDPQLKRELAKVADRVSQIRSVHRRSNFSMSDFSNSDFRYCIFQNTLLDRASFRDASCRGTDLRGADFTDAIVDDRTKFPKPR